MKKTAMLVILPEFKNQSDVERWESNLKWAYDTYNTHPIDENQEVSIVQRWALGFVYWNVLSKYLGFENTVDVYFLRTDFRLTEEYSIDEENIISVKFDNPCGHIVYKTLVTMDLLKEKYDYFVRGNLNTIVDLYTLNKFVQDLPADGIFTSPLWEGGSYAFGHFFLVSRDVACYLVDQGIQQRWLEVNTADDYEIAKVILTKYDYYTIPGCDEPWISTYHEKPKISDSNKRAIRFDGGPGGESSEVIIDGIKKSDKDIFHYRIKKISDNKYFTVYTMLIKHIWGKVVEERFGLEIYNENNGKVPHIMYERDEQLLAAKYIDKDDVVLELGARYGSVSCIINKIIENKNNQVSVEPEPGVWEVLEKNMNINNCDFKIFKGIVSDNNYELNLNGYGSTIDIKPSGNEHIMKMEKVKTKNISLYDLQKKYGLEFNVLVADCEGFLETFLDEYPILYTQLYKIMFECDRGDVCDYNRIKSELVKNGFSPVEIGFQCVYIKK